MNHQAEYLEEELRKAWAEIEEMRQRVCVPEGYVVVPVKPTEDMLGATSWPRCAATDYKHMLAAAPAPVERLATDGGRNQRFEGLFEGETPDQRDARLASAAPVERVEQEPVAWRVSHPCGGWKTYGTYPAWAEGDVGLQIQPLYTTPQPAPTAAQDVARLVEALEHEFPLLPDNGLDEVAHHCEWAIQQDRKRLHALIAAHQSGGAK